MPSRPVSAIISGLFSTATTITSFIAENSARCRNEYYQFTFVVPFCYPNRSDDGRIFSHTESAGHHALIRLGSCCGDAVLPFYLSSMHSLGVLTYRRGARWTLIDAVCRRGAVLNIFFGEPRLFEIHVGGSSFFRAWLASRHLPQVSRRIDVLIFLWLVLIGAAQPFCILGFNWSRVILSRSI